MWWFQSTHRVSNATLQVHWLHESLKFQSTHRVSNATKARASADWSAGISIHAPREQCDGHHAPIAEQRRISIHAPREQCDLLCGWLSVWAAMISIHAPREQCDGTMYAVCLLHEDFNPRTAWAMRRMYSRNDKNNLDFNPRTAWAMRPQIRNLMTSICFLFQFYDKQSWVHLQYFL